MEKETQSQAGKELKTAYELLEVQKVIEKEGEEDCDQGE